MPRPTTAPDQGVCEWSPEGLHDKSVFWIPNTDEILKFVKKKMNISGSTLSTPRPVAVEGLAGVRSLLYHSEPPALLVVLSLFIGTSLQFSAVELLTTAGPLCPSQYQYGTVLMTLCVMVLAGGF